jgi:hypothetical protein
LHSPLLCEIYQALAVCLTSETRLIHEVDRLIVIAKQWKRQNYDKYTFYLSVGHGSECSDKSILSFWVPSAIDQLEYKWR